VEARGGLDEDGVEQLLALLAADNPAAHVRVVLAYMRERGESFDLAWGTAMRSIPRSGLDPAWRGTLREMRPAFRAAYDAHVLAGSVR
jgi:hypothetical protein